MSVFFKVLYSFVQIASFIFTNSVDPDKMEHFAAFYLGFLCLFNIIPQPHLISAHVRFKNDYAKTSSECILRIWFKMHALT